MIIRRLSGYWYLVRLRRRYRKLFRDPSLVIYRDGRYVPLWPKQ